MIIGFTQRRQTVSEGENPGYDFFFVSIDVATLRVSEREYTLLYQVFSSGSATVVSFSFYGSDFDARFGNVESDPLEQIDFLYPGDSVINSILIAIRNDFIPEEEECFSIRIDDYNELFTCDRDGINSTNYFCENTICIEDDDGKTHLYNSIYTITQL